MKIDAVIPATRKQRSTASRPLRGQAGRKWHNVGGFTVVGPCRYIRGTLTYLRAQDRSSMARVDYSEQSSFRKQHVPDSPVRKGEPLRKRR